MREKKLKDDVIMYLNVKHFKLAVPIELLVVSGD
jgi:hypothetical protein